MNRSVRPYQANPSQAALIVPVQRQRHAELLGDRRDAAEEFGEFAARDSSASWEIESRQSAPAAPCSAQPSIKPRLLASIATASLSVTFNVQHEGEDGSSS
jgi:hypothetical protein